MTKIYDVVIIGSGPAGMSAAIYAKRAELDVLILDYYAPGGKLLLTNKVENYPGISDISGVDLSLQMVDQMNKLGISLKNARAKQIIDGEIKKIILEGEDEIIETRTIIIATGTSEKKLGIPGEEKYRGYGISYCAICDGSLFRDVEIATIGGGNSALEESLYLSDFVSKLHLIIRRDKFRADPIIQRQISKKENIKVYYDTLVTEILGDGKHVTGLALKDKNTDKEYTLDIKGVFPLIGAVPATSFVKDLGILNEKGFIKVNLRMETELPGIYGAGDVCQKELRQIVTATNDGAIAAQEIYKYLKGENQ